MTAFKGLSNTHFRLLVQMSWEERPRVFYKRKSKIKRRKNMERKRSQVTLDLWNSERAQNQRRKKSKMEH